MNVSQPALPFAPASSDVMSSDQADDAPPRMARHIATAPRAQPVPPTADTVIIGGGIMGLSIAYHLAKRGHTDVVVLEKSYLASGASGRNGGGVRQQWSTEVNIRLMQESVALCKRSAVELGVNVWFRQGGYLFLARTATELQRLERNIALQNRCGVETRLLDARAARDVVPQLDITGITGAAYNPTDGILFPWPFLWGYAQNAVARGVQLYTHTSVLQLSAERSGGFTVTTDRGTMRARRVVNAAGVWSPQLASHLGVTIPTHPVRHEICSSEPLKPFLGPMVSELTSGLYCSQSMRGELVGGITIPGHDHTAQMHSSQAFLPTYARRLTKLMPSLAPVKVLRQWAGPYDASPDGNPILGEVAAMPGFYVACGFVGHGFMMAPIVGKLYADWLVGDAPHPIFTMYPLERFARGGSSAPREDFNIG